MILDAAAVRMQGLLPRVLVSCREALCPYLVYNVVQATKPEGVSRCWRFFAVKAEKLWGFVRLGVEWSSLDRSIPQVGQRLETALS